MSERELKLFDFQEEIVKNTFSETIVCNLSRGLGKDFILIEKILYENPKLVYFVGDNHIFTNFSKKIKEINSFDESFRKNLSKLIIKKDCILIKLIDKNEIKILKYLEDMNEKADMAIYNEVLPYNKVNARKHISVVSMNTCDLHNNWDYGNGDVYEYGMNKGLEIGLFDKKHIEDIKKNTEISIFKNEIDILNEYKENEESNNIKIQKLIKRLLEEYSKIPMNSNTTIYREKILNQIQMLNDIQTLNDKNSKLIELNKNQAMILTFDKLLINSESIDEYANKLKNLYK